MAELDTSRYPIGKFEKPEIITESQFTDWLNQMETLPARVERLVKNLPESELNLQYREGSWTIRQLVHHLADSHMNAYMRIKLALTEDQPTIKPYHQEGWAGTPDNELPQEVPLSILTHLHGKMVYILRNLSEEQLNRAYFHPDNKDYPSLKEITGMYAWHGEHHLAHIKMALEKR